MEDGVGQVGFELGYIEFVNNILSMGYKYLIEYIENRGQLGFNNKKGQNNSSQEYKTPDINRQLDR